MGAKLEDLDFKHHSKFKPGPGNYDNEKANFIPTTKFGSGQRGDLESLKEQQHKPGPGTYDGDDARVQTAAPKYGFGSAQRPSESKLHEKPPGPGHYMARTFTGEEGSKFSMAGQLNFEPHRKEQDAKPGPNYYNPDSSPTKQKDSAWTIGKDVRRDLKAEKMNAFQASPAQYDPDYTATKNKAAGWRMGTEQRPPVALKGHDKLPGAGTYQLPSRLSEGPKIQMHAKLKSIDKNNNPGPNSYNLQDSSNPRQSTSPKFTLGTSQRYNLGGGKES